MSETPTAVAESTQGKPRTQRFRRTFQGVVSTPDQRRREAAVMRLAWDALRSRERIMAFLNDDHPVLGGRPLQLASDSDEGLDRVTSHLARYPTEAVVAVAAEQNAGSG